MRSDLFRALGWIIPIVCMAIAGWVLYGQNQAFADASARRNQAEREVQEAQKEYDMIKRLSSEHHYAAEDDTQLEETAFLTYLHARSAANNVRWGNYNTQSTVYGKDKQGANGDPKVADLLKGIRKISSTLNFLGDYQNLRKLLGELESSDRLYTLTNITWSLTDKGTTLNMTISRYVQPAPPAPKAPAGGAAKPGAPAANGPAGTPVKPGAPLAGQPAGSTAPVKMGAVAPTQPGIGGAAHPAAPQPSKASPGVTSKP